MKDTFKVAFFVIGNLIGAGFFLMPASVAPLGGNLIWSWTIGALIAFTFALIFGRLYILYPNSKDLSDYFDDIHLKRAIALLYWIGIVVGNVIVLTMIISVLKVQSFSNALLLAYSLLLVLGCGNYFFKENDIAKIETVLSLLKFFLLILIPIIIFISDYSKISIPSCHGSVCDVFNLGVLSFWSFMGIETAGVFGSGKSARNGLLIGIAACFLLYVSSCFLIVGSVPLDLLSSGGEIPLVYLIQFSKFSYFDQYVSYLIAFTSLASLYGWFATSSKIALSFAESSLFPSFCKKKTKSGASFWGLWGSSLLTFLAFSLVACFNIGQQFEIIADFCVNISLIIFALCSNVLYMQSETMYDNLLSLFGMICVILLLSVNILFSLFSVFLFIFTYYVSKYFSK